MGADTKIEAKGGAMSKHTPGPWKIEPYVDAINIHAADGSMVARIADRRLDSHGMPPDNARLIAAAPDLLAACLALMATLGEMIEEGCCAGLDSSVVPDVVDRLDAAKSMAESAIAKAKGGAA